MLLAQISDSISSLNSAVQDLQSKLDSLNSEISQLDTVSKSLADSPEKIARIFLTRYAYTNASCYDSNASSCYEYPDLAWVSLPLVNALTSGSYSLKDESGNAVTVATSTSSTGDILIGNWLPGVYLGSSSVELTGLYSFQSQAALLRTHFRLGMVDMGSLGATLASDNDIALYSWGAEAPKHGLALMGVSISGSTHYLEINDSSGNPVFPIFMSSTVSSCVSNPSSCSQADLAKAVGLSVLSRYAGFNPFSDPANPVFPTDVGIIRVVDNTVDKVLVDVYGLSAPQPDPVSQSPSVVISWKGKAIASPIASVLPSLDTSFLPISNLLDEVFNESVTVTDPNGNQKTVYPFASIVFPVIVHVEKDSSGNIVKTDIRKMDEDSPYVVTDESGNNVNLAVYWRAKVQAAGIQSTNPTMSSPNVVVAQSKEGIAVAASADGIQLAKDEVATAGGLIIAGLGRIDVNIELMPIFVEI